MLGYNLEYMSLTDSDICKLWTKNCSTYNRNTDSYDYYTYLEALLNEYGYTAK